MMKKEFEEIVRAEIDEKDYAVIETVYKWYSERLTKEEAAKLYTLFGIKIFKDMLPRSQRIAELAEQQQELQWKLTEISQELKNLEEGREENEI